MEWVDWASENAKPIQSVDSSDFSDLQFLKEVLEDKQVVFLGESSHGVSEYQALKARLIKFLHKEMGFNVLAFESGLAETTSSFHLMEGMTSEEMMKESIFGVWHSEESSSLFSYIQQKSKTDRPLTLTGFDIQFQNSNIYQQYFQTTYQFLDNAEENIASLEKRFKRLWDETSQEELTTLAQDYESLLNTIEQHPHPDSKIQMLHERILEYRIIAIEKFYTVQNSPEFKTSDEKTSLLYNIRDDWSAKNLEWLIEEYFPEEKIIVYAHNGHIEKSRSNAFQWNKNLQGSRFDFISMGERMATSLGDRAYYIGLYMNEGKAAFNDRKEYVIAPRPKGSMEWIVSSSNHDISFIDFGSVEKEKGSEWIFKPTPSFIDGNRLFNMIPSRQYDGVIVFKEVTPPRYITN
ncbi:erythromycin esterase family protein [Pseudalkalibacillus sp. SCS-8]|uniref:erythromycin esterase family protein n=1 Tax=Pseudalkalibacillus nanhaiensis TaxID=3115291 RepID=UPI0032DB0C5F